MSKGDWEEREMAVQVARAEVAERSWGTSKQFLAAHCVSTGIQGEPLVARVAEAPECGAYLVYFPIHEEPYYLVVVVSTDESGRWQVSGVYWEGEVRVYMAISSRELSSSEISGRVGLLPTQTRSVGEPIVELATKTCEEHRWILEPQAGMPGSVEEKLAALLDAVHGASERIAALRPSCNISVVVVYSAWGGDPQFGAFTFADESVRRLAELGAALAFDLYASGPEMPEDGAITL